jgi:hypothetical protein
MRSVVSPEGQSATFIELFFDLVFVFSVTQTVSLLHGELRWLVVGQAVLVFWLVWWPGRTPRSGPRTSANATVCLLSSLSERP